MCPALTGVCVPEAVARSPPGPPQLAGQAFSRHKGSPSTRCCVGGTPGVEGVCSLRLCKCRQSAERSGIPSVGCSLSVSVSCRTRSRRPTPSRPAPGRRVRGRDCKIRGRCASASALFGARFRKKYGSNAGWFLSVQKQRLFNTGVFVCKKQRFFQGFILLLFTKKGRTLYSAFVCEG